jgi:hypothetical protein
MKEDLGGKVFSVDDEVRTTDFFERGIMRGAGGMCKNNRYYFFSKNCDSHIFLKKNTVYI